MLTDRRCTVTKKGNDSGCMKLDTTAQMPIVNMRCGQQADDHWDIRVENIPAAVGDVTLSGVKNSPIMDRDLL